tara:strand:+ start:196 stop:1953 length:1758 start_codon:yes stop_codon:yes gene_type:complete
MKFVFIIFFILFSKSIFANEENNTEVEVINLYESKSLDQMVLDNLNEEEIIEEEVENSNENVEIANNEVEVKQIDTVKLNFIQKNELKNLNNYLNNLKKINTQTLQKEIIEVLENLQLNFELEKDREIFFLIINYLQSVGQINKSYELIEAHDLSNDTNYSFYTGIKLNYLLSTFQLNEACNFSEELNSNIKLDFFFLEKLDIFCLILNDNQSEAYLLNSILKESEKNLDIYYQNLFSLITNSSDQISVNPIENSEINKELIFLYSAMTRIAELPFSHEFYELDKKNLSIPIILNQSSPIDLRIKAANESFLENLITVDSLAALYMSADFNSDQLNNPKETVEAFLDNKELSMAFLYQLVNIQIFPNDRLNILIQFWNFAKENNLEEIAYKLSINMLTSIEADSENIIHGPQIASAYIFNNDFDNAVNWIELYENAKEVDSKSIYARILLDLYSSSDLNSFINSINLTLNTYTYGEDNANAELLYVLKTVMNLDINSNSNISLDKIFDNRTMPSIFLLNEIDNSILNNDDEKFLFYSMISLNDKEWNDIHPEHLRLILHGYLKYKDGILFRNLILEVFKNFKFII